MSAAETELLIMVAEGVKNKVVHEIAGYMAVATAGNKFLTGYSKPVTDKAAADALEGEAWLARLNGLIDTVIQEAGQ